MANPYPEGSPLFYIAEGARIYEEMVADPRHPYHQPCERVSTCCGGHQNLGYRDPMWCYRCGKGTTTVCKAHGKPWGECEVKAG